MAAEKKNFFFLFYSIYQNVCTSRLKWRLPKVDITSGCLTIMVYFCNNKWAFIPTKVQLYCVFVFGNYEVSNAFLLLHRAYIFISGIKWKKNFFFKKFSAKKISCTPHMKFWWLRKKFFFPFYSIYQNVRTGRLKWRLPKVDITSGCLTIMVYFCNNKWVFNFTKV